MRPDSKAALIHAFPFIFGLIGLVSAVYTVLFVGCYHYNCVDSDYRLYVVFILIACLILFAYDLYVLARLFSRRHLSDKLATVFKLCILVMHVGLFLSVFVVFDYVAGRI